MAESIIGLGSNLGDREANLRRAIRLIGRRASISGMSSVYETEPMYHEDQGWFLNAVIAMETDMKPRPLLEWLQGIERELGRQRTVRYGPRTIDLDILFYAGEVVSEPGLEIPHPGIVERPFVLVPLDEVRPDLIHPLVGKKVSELLREAGVSKQVVRRSDLLSDLACSPPRRP